MSPAEAKDAVGRHAADSIEPGMRLGIGTGSTAECFIHALAARVRGGLDIVGVATSERTAALCRELGVPLTDLEDTPVLELTVDGADEVDPALRLIKGGGGALLREKIVAAASRRMIVIADDSKAVDALGAFPLPVEVMRFGLSATRGHILAGLERYVETPDRLSLRMEATGQPFVTDQGNRILDLETTRIHDPEGLAAFLSAVPGVVEHGLFIGMASAVIYGGAGGVRVVEA